MDKKIPRSSLGVIVVLGAVWGLSEAALGLGLRTCASFISGSLMTGVALFFMAVCWTVSRNALGIALIVVTASLFKLIDAFFLSLPILHGAVGNPIFAFVMEGLAFLIIVSIIKDRLLQKKSGQALAGGFSALLAVNLFPLVKYATGIPACVAPGTGYPLSLYYAYVAVAVSLMTFPLGVLAGAKIRTIETSMIKALGTRKLQFIAPPAAVLICLAIIFLIRSI